VTMAQQPMPLYLGVDSAPVPRGEVLRFLAAELGVADPGAGAPASATAGGSSRNGRASGPRGGDKVCSNALLLASGFRFAYPGYRDGYLAILAGTGIRHP